MSPYCISLGKAKLALSCTMKRTLLMRVYDIYRDMLVLSSQGCRKPGGIQRKFIFLFGNLGFVQCILLITANFE
jgi:hypothetical protein